MNNSAFKSLQKLHVENEIGLVELEFARFLIRMDSAINDVVLFSAILTVHDQIHGNICTDLQSIGSSKLAEKLSLTKFSLNELKSFLDDSELVGAPGDYVPLILEGNKLYLHKYWSFESKLVDWIIERTKQPDTQLNQETKDKINFLFPANVEFDYQKFGVYLANLKSFLIISGGPGTGKTYTVKKIVESILVNNANSRIGMAAPTGKAAERLNQSLADLDNAPEAVTLHRLLGARMDGTFRFNDDEKLPLDVVIVDEASMLDIRMWVCLTNALNEKTKLILLGDKDQLSSVEAGSVLGDICADAGNSYSTDFLSTLNISSSKPTLFDSTSRMSDHIVLLNKSYRTGESTGIPQLARAINNQQIQEFNTTIDSHDNLQLINPSQKSIEPIIENYCDEILKGEYNTQFLCSNKLGEYGTLNINDKVEYRLKKKKRIALQNEWYDGRRVLITQNNYSLGLSNGQIGICRETTSNTFMVHFDEHTKLAPSELTHYSPAFAITVHKSQGSEFNNVVIFLPEHHNSVLFKELLYTAVTRARLNTLIIGKGDIIEQTINTSARRNSGISDKLK